MSILPGSPHDEILRLADDLDNCSVRIGNLAAVAFPCWITEGNPRQVPINWDGDRPLFVKRKYARRASEPHRNLWLCQENETDVDPILEVIGGIGVKLGQISDEAKAIVYVNWCRHCLTSNDSIAASMEALFPSNSYGFIAGIPGTEMSRICGPHGDGRSMPQSQLDLPNMAEAANNAAQHLSTRLRNNPRPIELPEGNLCCDVAYEEERIRPKRPEEILPRIRDLRSIWVRADDLALFRPQREIDNLWADMIHLEWQVGPCPELPVVVPFSQVVDPPKHKTLWRAYHAALSDAEGVARSHATFGALRQYGSPEIGEIPSSGEPAYSDPEDLDRRHSQSPAEVEVAGKCTEARASEANPSEFSGGTMSFLADRVELCGVDICSGGRSQLRRRLLDLLRKRGKDGAFAAYSGDDLAQQLVISGNQNTVAGAIRDLRNGIIEALWNHAKLACGRQDVIVSGGRGYRLADCISVQDGDKTEITDITDIEAPGRVREAGVRDVRDLEEVHRRRIWILDQLHQGSRVKASTVATRFNCSKKTAERDLLTLKNDGKVEFVGSARTGCYRLAPPPGSVSD